MDGQAEHARLAPSSADKRVGCPGSLLMEEMYGNDIESDEMREGTAAHWVLLELAREQPVCEGLIAPNGVMITEEMIDGAQAVLADVDERLRPYPDAALGLTFEQPVDCTHIHPDNWGTPDIWGYIPEDGQVFIWDFKFGHKFVPADSWQLINYAAGILQQIGVNGLQDQYIKVTFIIVQPRYFHGKPVRSWSCMASDLRGMFNTLINTYAEATGPNPQCKTGEWCGTCSAAHMCETFHKSTSAAVDYIDSVTVVDFDDTSLGVEMAILESAIDRCTARLKALKVDAEARIAEGRSVWLYHSTPVYGRQKWTAPIEDVLNTGELYGANLAKPPQAITPKQAITAGVDPEVVNSMSETPRNGYAVVRREKSIAYLAFNKRA